MAYNAYGHTHSLASMGVQGAYVKSSDNDGFDDIPANGYQERPITFPKSYASAPVVVATFSTNGGVAWGSRTISVHSVTTTGFIVRAFNNTSSSTNAGYHWIAFGTLA